MHAIFLFIHLVFASVFYFFGKIPETAIFAILGVVFFFVFGPFDFKKKPPAPAGDDSKKIALEARRHAIRFLKSGTYYLGFLFFYLSFYGIAYSLAGDFGYPVTTVFEAVATVISLSVILTYALLGPSHDVAGKLFRSNAFVFSGIYFSILAYRIFFGGGFAPLFVVNAAISLGCLATVVWHGGYSDFRQRGFAYLFLLAFAYACFVAVPVRALGTDPFRTALSVLFLQSVAVFDGLTRIRPLRELRPLCAYSWAVLSYVAVVATFAYLLFRGVDAFILGLSAMLGGFQAYVHAKHENYLSLLSLALLGVFLYGKTFFPDPTSGFFPFLAFCFGFPAIAGGIAKWRTFHRYDRHFLYGSGIAFATVASGSYFFRFSSYEILEISLLLLANSALMFVSYLGLRK